MNRKLVFGCALASALAAATGPAGAADRTGEQIVKMQCIKCHETGANGAPKIDDRAAWSPRMKNGLEATVRSAINGHGKMPARGGIASLNDTELRNAILYMFYPAGAEISKRPAAPAAVQDPHRKTVSGMEVDLGIVVAATAPVKQKAPAGKGWYYVNISLRDSASGAAVKDAELQARVANPVTGGETKKLEPNGEASYGNFFRMQGKEPYTIAVQVRRPGAPAAAEVKFDFKP